MIRTVMDDRHQTSIMASQWLANALPSAKTLLVAGGNSALELYKLVAERKLSLSHLKVFVLDEYVELPKDEPRSTGNLLRDVVVRAWGIPESQYFTVSPLKKDQPADVLAHERRIEQAGGLDISVVGLGKNGHIGFNEPGSPGDARARLVDLEPISVEANRTWFGGRHVPDKGATVGLKTIRESKSILLIAYGGEKADAVRKMIEGPQDSSCPASFLRDHPKFMVFLDAAAASKLKDKGS